jgi:surface antigen
LRPAPDGNVAAVHGAANDYFEEVITLKKIIVGLMAAGLVASLGACTNQDTGAVVGGVLGGALGSNVGKGKGRTVAIIAGTLAGAAIGGSIGRSMDETDRMRANQVLETSPSHQPTSWRNPDNGNQYTVTPVKTYEEPGGQYCREYQTEAVINGRSERAYGTACRQPDGSWQIQN